ncbi:MAG: FKBP-type peptidyl-prolyl cis-trans isomerase [Bacteroidales bacterium]
MKKNLLVVPALLLAGAITACTNGNNGISDTVSLKTETDSVSYAIGLFIGGNGNQQLNSIPESENLNMDIVLSAIKTLLSEKDLAKLEKSQLTPEQANEVLQAYSTKASERVFDANLKKGEDFLAENAKRDGIIVTESGLQYEVLKEGTGAIPTDGDEVKVDYTGTLIDGTKFDSSIDRGQPATFNVNGVVKGFSEALKLMPIGSKWKVYIPQDLGYGKNTRQGSPIESGSALIFEIDLLDIVKASEAQ